MPSSSNRQRGKVTGIKRDATRVTKTVMGTVGLGLQWVVMPLEETIRPTCLKFCWHVPFMEQRSANGFSENQPTSGVTDKYTCFELLDLKLIGMFLSLNRDELH
ncbi:hypothetical protein TNCV_1652161 [Trichonephila clavipes]|nr:hypothetical protein TNCV_1652161 [Trichonephila clavipes]